MEKTALFLVGPSGSGKSTVVNKIKSFFESVGLHGMIAVHSMDIIRINLYASKNNIPIEEVRYEDAWEYCSREASEFTKAKNKDWNNLVNDPNIKLIIIDNVNATRKARNFYISDGKNRGIRFVGIEFMTPLSTVLERQHTRSDKKVEERFVIQQYNQIQGLMLGTEVEKMLAHDGREHITNNQIVELLS